MNPKHLWLGTVLNNNQDRDDKDRQTKTLTDQQVREILESDEPQQILVDRYSVKSNTISNIKRGKRRKYIKGKRYTSDASTNSQTDIKGVSPHKASGKYQAQISFKGKDYYLGIFDTIEEAEKVVIAKRRELSI